MIVKRHTLSNALRVAAEQFESDAQDQPQRIAEQFERQALEARALADMVEQCDTIRLED